jgi:hypothetical protein
VQFARTLGTSTRSTNELERNLLEPENAKKVRTFRLLTTLTALVKMLIWRQSVFQPDFAMAQRMWDEWDRRLDQQYGLPRLTPRKNAKRINDCLTFTIMNAVACVFLFKQTACHFETYPLHGEEPLPFDVSQLWRCVQMLQPTPEIIHYAWTCSLEQMIGTSCMGLAALSAVCDLYGRKPGDLLRRPPAWSFSEMETLCKDLNEQKKNVGGSSKDTPAAATAAAAAAAGVNNGFGAADSADHAAVVRNMTRPMSMRKRPRQAKQMFEGANELVPLFRGVDSEISREYVSRMRDMFRFRRQARVAYRMRNVESTHSRKNFDSNAHIDETLEPKLGSVAHLGKDHHNADQHTHLHEHGLPVYEAAVVDLHPSPPNSLAGSAAHREMLSRHQLRYLPPAEIFGINEADPMDKQRQDIAAQEQAYLNGVSIGVHAYNANEEIDDYVGDPNFEAIHRGFQSRMAVAEGIDSSNCPCLELDHHDPSTCVFCNQSGPAQLISVATSTVWADGVEAACFYSLQNLCEFALNAGILIDKTSGIPGMRPLARNVAFKATGQTGESTGPSSGGTTSYDLGWMCKQACGSKSPWDRVARQMENHSWHLKAMDLHHEGIRDLLYLISMRDNARRVGVLPGISDLKSGMVDEYGHHPNDNSKLVRFVPKAPAPSFGLTETKFRPEVFPPRHPASLVPDNDFQRACDARLASGQLLGLEVLSSANVIRSPPIRHNYEFMEASTTCMHDHVCLLVESSLSATLMPGLTNLQESFSNGEVGPAGFSSRTSKSTKAKEEAKRGAKDSSAEAASAVAAGAAGAAASSGQKGPQATLANSVASLSEVGALPDKASDAEPPSKRAATNDDGRSVAEQTEASELIPDGEGIHTLAYSYDVIQISIALDMSECLYDSTKATRLESQQSSTTHKLVENEHHLAHISLRFPGYETNGRQTISMPVQTKPMADITMPEDAIESNKRVSRRHVSLVLGRHATEADVQAYVRRLSGARNMDGVQGNLFDAVTWLKHTVHSLRRRGLLHGVANAEVGLEPAFAIMRSMPTGLLERFVEACYLDKKPGFEHLDLDSIAIRGSYWSKSEDQPELPKKENGGARASETLHEHISVPAPDKPVPKLTVTTATSTEVDLSPVEATWASVEETQPNNGVPLTEEDRQEVLSMRSECVNPLKGKAAAADDDEVEAAEAMEED